MTRIPVERSAISCQQLMNTPIQIITSKENTKVIHAPNSSINKFQYRSFLIYAYRISYSIFIQTKPMSFKLSNTKDRRQSHPRSPKLKQPKTTCAVSRSEYSREGTKVLFYTSRFPLIVREAEPCNTCITGRSLDTCDGSLLIEDTRDGGTVRSTT